MNLLLVALGSAIGGVLRVCISAPLNTVSMVLPWGTLAVNVAGSLIIGILTGLVGQVTGNVTAIRSFAIVGLCGGFTTFSTFSNETFRMIEDGRWFSLALYVALSVVGGCVAVALGFMLTHGR